MKKKIISTVFLFVMLIGITANAETTINSKGRIQYGTEVVFDASDLNKIEADVTEGKTNVVAAVNGYTNGGSTITPTGAFPTWDEIVNGINGLTEVPADTYFYDKTTGVDDASTIKRYKKVGTEYFECSGNGTLVDDTADSVTAENLVEYTGITDGSLSAGTAGYADKSLVLGDGTDNINYKNIGYAKGYADGLEKTGNATYTYHVHTDACYGEAKSVIEGNGWNFTGIGTGYGCCDDSHGQNLANFKYTEKYYIDGVLIRTTNFTNSDYACQLCADRKYKSGIKTTTSKVLICGKTEDTIESATITF